MIPNSICGESLHVGLSVVNAIPNDQRQRHGAGVWMVGVGVEDERVGMTQATVRVESRATDARRCELSRVDGVSVDDERVGMTQATV